MTCSNKLFSYIFIAPLTVCCWWSHYKSSSALFIKICIKIWNPKVISISYFLMFIFFRTAKRQSPSICRWFCLYLIHIEWRICHNVITASFKIMCIMIKAVCFVTWLNNSCKTMYCHIHKTKFGIIFYFFLTIKSHATICL